MQKDLFPEQEDESIPLPESEEEISLSFSPAGPADDQDFPEEAEEAVDTGKTDDSQYREVPSGQPEAVVGFESLDDFVGSIPAEFSEEANAPEPVSDHSEVSEEAVQTAGTHLDAEANSPDGTEDAASASHSGETCSALTAPQIGEEIKPDEIAMNFHGMRNHGEVDPPFDMSLLDDPDLALPQEDSDASEDEENDQEYRDNGKTADMSNGPAEEEKPVAKPRPIRKGRPKRKHTEWLLGIPQMISTVVWLVLIVAIGVTAGRMLWVCAADVLAFGREDRAVTVTIYESDTMDDIIEKLYSNGLIRYKGLFSLYASISHAEEDIQPGIYDLNTLYDYHALVSFMSPRSSREVVDLTIPEGYSCRQIFSLLEEKRICTAVDIGTYAASGELDDYWFLDGVTRGDKYCLEGYLFPDTYQFYKNSTPREALQRMLDNFEVKFSDEMRAQLEELNANVTGGGYTVREVTTVASLIEKESAAPMESPRIAGVIYNRLFRWGDTPAYLNIDASIIYALDGKTDLTREDLQIDSPYNTYNHIGLPPTPISNPGLASLQAALTPEAHNYYYYVLNPATGMHQFSTTYEEHSGYVAQFAEGE